MVNFPSRAQAQAAVCKCASFADLKLQETVASTINKICRFIMSQDKIIFTRTTQTRMGSVATTAIKHHKSTIALTLIGLYAGYRALKGTFNWIASKL